MSQATENEVGPPCQAITSKGKCSCEGFVKAPGTQDRYVVCAVEGCGNTQQVHYYKTDEVKKVRR